MVNLNDYMRLLGTSTRQKVPDETCHVSEEAIHSLMVKDMWFTERSQKVPIDYRCCFSQIRHVEHGTRKSCSLHVRIGNDSIVSTG